MERPMGYIRYMWEYSSKQIMDYIETIEKKLECLKKEIEGHNLTELYDIYLEKKCVDQLEQKIIELENKLNEYERNE